MLVIHCPYCGARDQREFAAKGQAHIARPADPASCSDQEWGEYLFFRDNPKGWHYERWQHVHGCRRIFNALRHTVTDRFHATYRLDEPKPAIPEGDGQ